MKTNESSDEGGRIDLEMKTMMANSDKKAILLG
jgi:hypothetical protein